MERSDSKAGRGGHLAQSFNAQAAVEIESRLIAAPQVSDAPNDKEQLLPTLQTLSPVVESVAAGLKTRRPGPPVPDGKYQTAE